MVRAPLPSRPTAYSNWARKFCRGALAGGVLLGCLAPAAVAAPTAMVDLGQASTYAVLSGASVGNTVNAPGAPHTTLRGDLGVTANTQPTGFPPGIVTGATRVGSTADQAHADLVAAYTEVAGRAGGTALPGDLAGTTLTPGLHSSAAAVANTGIVTLDGEGDSNAVFVFKVGGALTMAAGARVTLTNGAQASHIFWQVNGAAAVGANAKFAGTLMALDAVAIGAGTQVNGRAMARNGAISLDSNEFYSAPPVVTIDGGATAITTDTTPAISGTTDVEAPGVVTVTVAGQILTATPADGTWSVTSAILANATYPVVASVNDAAGNPGSATQQLTIDTVLPIVAVDGGASLTTNDSTPTITGTSDVAPGTVVHVSVDSQALTALVQPGGTWNITPASLPDGTRDITASVFDPAGNEGVDTQALTIDTIPPAVTIDGGANALTNDPTPVISGTAIVAIGTTVTVTLADETLTTSVQPGGTWSVTAAALSDGAHRIVMSVADSAGNPAGFSQRLVVDTVPPLVAITGGATATTENTDPTITGTSDAAAGTTVTVTIAGQTMSTLVQANGTWNTTPNVVGKGEWPVVASDQDPAGNVGSASQTLTIGAPVVPPATTTPPHEPLPTPAPPATPPPGTGGLIDAVTGTTVARSATQKVHGFPLMIGTKVTAPAKGPVVATATGTVRISGVKPSIRLTTATIAIDAGRSATLKLRLKGSKRAVASAFRTIRAATRRHSKVTATITVRLVDAAGHARTVTRTVKLTR